MAEKGPPTLILSDRREDNIKEEDITFTGSIASILASPNSKQYLRKLANSLSEEQFEELTGLMRERRTIDNDCFITKLPREIWIMILKKLTPQELVSFSMTSKSFKDLCLDPKLWSQTEWTVTQENLLEHPESYATLLLRLPKLKKLCIEEKLGKTIVKEVSKETKIKFKSCFSELNIQILDLQLWKTKDQMRLDMFVSTFTNLQEIDVEVGDDIFCDHHVITVANNSPALKKFSVVEVEGRKLTDKAIKLLAEKCPMLESFGLGSCGSGVTDQGINHIISRCHNLVEIFLATLNITEKSIKKIGELCPNLKVLDIGWMEFKITDKVMEKVATNCTRLEHLGLSDVEITDQTLVLLGRNCQEIKDLELLGCETVTEAGIRNFVSQGTKPLKLSVDCGWATPEFRKGLKNEYPRLKSI